MCAVSARMSASVTFAALTAVSASLSALGACLNLAVAALLLGAVTVDGAAKAALVNICLLLALTRIDQVLRYALDLHAWLQQEPCAFRVTCSPHLRRCCT